MSVLNWIELNWIELNWIELYWIELNWIELNMPANFRMTAFKSCIVNRKFKCEHRPPTDQPKSFHWTDNQQKNKRLQMQT